MSNMKKVAVNGKMCDVVSLEEYCNNKDLYLTNSTLIECDDFDKPMLLPIINPYDKESYGIRIQSGNVFAEVNLNCTEQQEEEYNPDNVIDLSKANSIKELMDKQDMIRDVEREIITTPDSITVPDISKDDEPAMKAIKMAITKKHIDLDKYAQRFGPNYNNDKRTILKNRISLQMLERMCDNLDMKATLIIEDANPDVANPIGDEPIVVELTRPKGGDE